MASSKEYLDFILEQLTALDGISYRAMMGEYIIYLSIISLTIKQEQVKHLPLLRSHSE